MIWLYLLIGARRTIELAAFAWLIGLPIGALAAFFSVVAPVLRLPLRLLAISITIIPFLAVLFWIHYPVQSFLRVVWDPFYTTIFLLGAYIAIVAADLLASELERLEDHYVETALVLGISKRTYLFRILLRGAMEQSMPRLLTLAIASIHMTMFASLIGVEELFRVTQHLNARFLDPVMLYSLMALFYAMLCAPLYLVAAMTVRRLRSRSA